MKHFILTLSDGGRQQASCFLRAKRWAPERDERHSSALAPGDLALTHVGRPLCEFTGHAELASAFRHWTTLESEARPDGLPGSALLADVVEWLMAVPLHAVVRRIDPTASNPCVQAKAAGFRSGIVLIAAEEFDAAMALGRESCQT
jgi:hypothetical protein